MIETGKKYTWFPTLVRIGKDNDKMTIIWFKHYLSIMRYEYPDGGLFQRWVTKQNYI